MKHLLNRGGFSGFKIEAQVKRIIAMAFLSVRIAINASAQGPYTADNDREFFWPINDLPTDICNIGVCDDECSTVGFGFDFQRTEFEYRDTSVSVGSFQLASRNSTVDRWTRDYGAPAEGISFCIVKSEFSVLVSNNYSTVNFVDFETSDATHALCTNQSANLASTLTYTNGVTWSGTGVNSSGVFSHGTAGTYNPVATRVFDNGTSTITFTITVSSFTSLTFNNLPDVCSDAGDIDLRDFTSPSGGTFSYSATCGACAVGNFFKPSQAPAGTHTVTFSRTNGNGCTSTITEAIKVASTFSLSAGSNLSFCNNSGIHDLDGTGESHSGSWSGAHVSNDQFNANSAPVGNHIVTLTSNQNGCVKTATKTIAVTALPTVEAGAKIKECTDVGNIPLNTAGVSPANGIWTGSTPEVDDAINQATGMINISVIAPGDYTLTYTFTNASTCVGSDTRDLEINGLPNATAELTLTPDERCGNGQLTLSASHTNGSYTFEWYLNSTGGTSLSSNANYSPTISATTDYWVEVISDEGCHSANRKKLTGTVHPVPVPPTSSPQPHCGPGMVTMTASGGITNATYNWFENSTGGIPLHTGSSYTAEVLTSRSFYVDAVSEEDCVSPTRTKVDVTINSVPGSATPFHGQNCGPSTIILSVGGTPPGGSYGWYLSDIGGLPFNTTDTWETPVLTMTTSYWVSIVTSENCEGPRTEVTALIDEIPNTPPVGQNDERCGEGPITLSVSSPEPNPTFNWYLEEIGGSPFANGPDFTIVNLTETTSYWVSVASEAGCESSRQFVTATFVEITPVNVGDNITLCVNSGVKDLTEDASVEGGIFTGNGVIQGEFHPDIAGVGTHIITYSLITPIGCLTDGTRIITVISDQSGGQGLDIGEPDFPLCINEGTVDLSVFPNIPGGVWTGDGVTLEVFTPPRVGNTTLTYTVDISGCLVSANKEFIVLEVPDAPTLSQSSIDACMGQIIELTASGGPAGTLYHWFLDDDSESFETGETIEFSPLSNTNLIIKAENAFNCFSEAVEIPVSVIILEVDIQASKQEVGFGERVDFNTDYSGAISYLWDFGDELTSTQQNPSHYYYDDGIFTVSLAILTEENCQHTIVKEDFITVNINGFDIVVGFSSGDSQLESISAYPVPFGDNINLKINSLDQGSTSFQVYSSNGRKLIEETHNLIAGESIIKLKALGLKKGLYLIRISNDKFEKEIKIIKR